MNIYNLIVRDESEELMWIGHFIDLDEVTKIVEENLYDISDGGSNLYAIIETVSLGLYQNTSERWYKYDEESHTYKAEMEVKFFS